MRCRKSSYLFKNVFSGQLKLFWFEIATSEFFYFRCIVLECAQKQEAAWLMAAYSPTLSNSLSEEPPRRAAPVSERTRLAGALRSARRALIDGGLLRRPPDLSAGGFLRNTLRRWVNWLIYIQMYIKCALNANNLFYIYNLLFYKKEVNHSFGWKYYNA